MRQPDFGWGATEADVIRWVNERLQAAGLRATPDAAELLAARTGANSGQVDSEIAKLSLSVGEVEAISESLVRDLVPQTREGGIFDLSNAIARRDAHASAATLQQLLRQGEKAVGLLLAAIVPTIRNLVATKALLSEHRISPPTEARFFAGSLNRLPPASTRHLPKKKDGSVNAYALGLAAMQCHRFSLNELRSALIACARANRDLVTSRLPDETVLHRLVVEITARRLQG